MSKKRYIRHHLKWRVDYDYLSKLSKEDSAWLSRFNDEYYLNIFDESDSVHDLDEICEYNNYHSTKKGTRKQQLMQQEASRRRDIVYNLPANPGKYSAENYLDNSITPEYEEYLDELKKIS